MTQLDSLVRQGVSNIRDLINPPHVVTCDLSVRVSAL